MDTKKSYSKLTKKQISLNWRGIYTYIFFLMLVINLAGCGSEESPEPVDGGILVETITPGGIYKGHDGMSIDAQGTLYVSNLSSGSGRTIFKVLGDGTPSVLNDELRGPMGHAFDQAGNLIVSNDRINSLTSIAPDGSATEFLSDPKLQGGSLVIDDNGNIYHTVYSTNTVYKITPDKEITTLAVGGSLSVPFGITLDDNGNVYVANFSNGVITKISSQGAINTLVTVPSVVGYITFANNKLYATGFSTHNIYEIDLDGNIQVLVGSGLAGNTDGSKSQATFFSPNGIVASNDGKILYISQANLNIRKITLK